MENNSIFAGAKFGDKFKTKDGRKAIYTIISYGKGSQKKHFLAIEGTSFTWEFDDEGKQLTNPEMNIVEKWRDENDIRHFAFESCVGYDWMDYGEDGFTEREWNEIDAFISGYKKALED